MPRNNNNNKNRLNRKRTRKPRVKRGYAPRPTFGFRLPDIDNKPKFTRTLRYQSDLTGTTTMTFYTADLLSMLLHVTNASTQAYGLMDSVKINSISIAVFNTSGNLESVTMKWESVNSPETLYTMLAQSAVPIRETFYPPDWSTARLWSNTSGGSVELFAITPSATTIEIVLDINLIYILNDAASAPYTLSAAATFNGIAARNMPASTGSGLRQFRAVGLSQVG